MTPSNLEAALPPAYPLHDKASDPLLSNFSFMGDTLDSVNDPIKWSNSELVSWLCAFENGKHKMFVKTFEESQLDGKDICFLPYTSLLAVAKLRVPMLVFPWAGKASFPSKLRKWRVWQFVL
jgi:hypothetical protein